MSLRPEIEFVKALLPRRSIFSRETIRGASTMSESKTVLLRAAEWQLARREQTGARKWTKRMAAVGATVALTTSVGVAYAAWSSSASGTAKAGSATAHTVSISATGVSAPTDLYPGGTGAISFKLDNTLANGGNAYGVTFDKVTALTVASDDTANCPSANVTNNLTLPLTLSSTISVAGNTLSGVQTIPAAVKMAPAAPDGCQSKSFTVTLTLTGASS
jgi:hypothetical protein